MDGAISMVTSGMSTVVSTIMNDTALCALALGIPFVGGCIKLARRLTHFS